jgi:hypothetical protein
VLAAALLPALLLLPQGAAADAAPSFANQRPGVAYVGTAACADCHSDLAESFTAHGMARTFAPIDPERPLADWTGSQVVVDATTGLRYQPYRDGDRFFIRESLLDERGREIHSLTREVHYALGSGINDQSYVHEANGFLRMLPLEWYTDEERWDFAPMFEVDNQRFSRRINVRCMVCHNAVPEIRSEAAARFALPLPGCRASVATAPGRSTSRHAVPASSRSPAASTRPSSTRGICRPSASSTSAPSATCRATPRSCAPAAPSSPSARASP